MKLALLFYCFAGCVTTAATLSPKKFLDPPTQAGPHVLWMWMNGQISIDGIDADLKAMSASGYTGLTLFNVGVGIPEGKIIYGSERWFELLGHAVDEAKRAGLTDFWMHQSPGYSGAGGPWVTPELGMQQLVWTETRLVSASGRNDTKLTKELQKPLTKGGHYKDIAVLAYPALKEESSNDVFRNEVAKIFINGTEKATDITKGIRLDKMLRLESSAATLDLEMKNLFTASAISIYRSPEMPLDTFDGARDYAATWTLQASNDSSTWNTLSSFGGPALRKMDAPAVSNFATTVAKHYRLKASRASWIAGIDLHSGPRFENWNYKAHAAPGSVPDAALSFENKFGYSMIDPEDVVDITKYMDNGTLKWTPREGTSNWTVVRFGHTATMQEMPAAPEAVENGLAVDLFSTEAVDWHIEHHIKPIVKKLQRHVGKTFKGVEIDSYEIGMQNWGGNFTEEFREKRGYDISAWLLCASGRIVKSQMDTDRFLFDFRRTHADLVAEKHYGHFRKVLNGLGLVFSTEPYGDGPFDSMQVAQNADIAFGEFWSRNTYGSDAYAQIGTSMGHAEGYVLNPAESFTGQPLTSKWTEHPYSLKALGDRQFTIGVNRLMMHQYAHNPEDSALPGMTMGPFGAHFSRKVTWQKQATGWTEYLKRAQWMLQQGRPVVDVACYYGEEPKPKTTETYLAPCLVPLGFGADILSRDTLLAMKVQDKQAFLPGTNISYSLIGFPSIKAASKEVLEKIIHLAEAGVGVILIGTPPSRALGLESTSSEILALGQKLWSARSNVFNGTTTSTSNALKTLGIEVDFSYTALENDAALYAIHKILEDSEFYFISNGRRSQVHAVVSLRTVAGVPQLWHPETGETGPCLYSQKNGRTFISLNLETSESVFVVFSSAKSTSTKLTTISRNGEALAQTFSYSEFNKAPFNSTLESFSYTFWARPETYRWGNVGFIIYPPIASSVYGSGHGAAGFGLGTNGFIVSEVSTGTPSSVLQVDKPITGWTAFAIVYNNNVPTVYINGRLAGTGKKSSFVMHPGAYTPDSIAQMKNRFEGDVLSLKVHNFTLPVEEIAEHYRSGKPTWPSPSPIQLQANGKSLIVRSNGNYSFIYDSSTKKTITINSVKSNSLSALSPWKVSFPAYSKIASPIKLQNLTSLHLHDDFDVAHFSGTAQYTTTFILPVTTSPKHKLFLSLGHVENIASVSVDGSTDKLLWKPPYELEITTLLKSNRKVHTLQVDVTNLWPNRLIGDESLPTEAMFNSTNENYGVEEFPDWYLAGEKKPKGRVTFTSWRSYKGDEPLFESGLLGPVEISSAEVVDL